MRITRLIGTLVLLAVVCAGCGSTDDTTKNALPASRIDSATTFLKQFVADGKAPGVLIQVTTPDGTWTHAVGDASTAPTAGAPQPIDPAMQHRIGSITKTFTTTLILKLVQEGKLKLDDPIAKYVNGVPAGDRITIRMLGNMTAGLSEYLGNPEFRAAFFADPARAWEPQELLAYSYAMGPEYSPGTSATYSNANTVLLGLAVEKIEGKPFEDVLEEKILRPNNLSHTVWPDDGNFSAPHVFGYTSLDPSNPIVDSTNWSPSQAYSAGQLISTLDDLTLWVKLLAKGTLLNADLQRERLRWDPIGDNTDNYHYDFGIEDTTGWLGHNGGIPGYMSYAVYHPAIDSSIVVFINSDKVIDGEPPVNPLLRDVSAILFPDNPVKVEFVR